MPLVDVPATRHRCQLVQRLVFPATTAAELTVAAGPPGRSAWRRQGGRRLGRVSDATPNPNGPEPDRPVPCNRAELGSWIRRNWTSLR